MIKVAAMGRKPLGREPANITLPKDLKAHAKAELEKIGETLSDLVEVLLRRHFKYPDKFAPTEKPKTRRK